MLSSNIRPTVCADTHKNLTMLLSLDCPPLPLDYCWPSHQKDVPAISTTLTLAVTLNVAQLLVAFPHVHCTSLWFCLFWQLYCFCIEQRICRQFQACSIPPSFNFWMGKFSSSRAATLAHPPNCHVVTIQLTMSISSTNYSQHLPLLYFLYHGICCSSSLQALYIKAN